MWAALGFTRAPLYTGVTWKAQNQVLGWGVNMPYIWNCQGRCSFCECF